MSVRPSRIASATTATVRPSAVRAVIIGVALAVTAAVVGAGASPGPAPHDTAAGRAHRIDPRDLSALLALTTGGNGLSATVDPSTARVQAKNPVGRPQAGKAPLSMDSPIQGGLTAHQAQAISARLVSAHQDVATAGNPGHWTPQMAQTAIERARSWIGMPYSWAGGTGAGPSPGRCDPGTGGDLDCHISGFDCSGLTLYAWAPYVGLAHFAQTQASTACLFHPTLAQLLPGDLVFFSGYLAGGIGHVAIYDGKGMVIEAPQSGGVVQRSPLAELIANDGAYRGAVRPMTSATPVLTPLGGSLPVGARSLTLHGTHLADVTAVHLRGADGSESTFTRFGTHTDTAIEIKAPARRTGVAGVSASTDWVASNTIGLAWAQPAPKPTARTTRPTRIQPTQTRPTGPSPTYPSPTRSTSPRPSPSRTATASPSSARTAGAAPTPRTTGGPHSATGVATGAVASPSASG